MRAINPNPDGHVSPVRVANESCGLRRGCGQPKSVLQRSCPARNAECFGSTADNTILTKQVLEVKNCSFKRARKANCCAVSWSQIYARFGDESVKVQADSLPGGIRNRPRRCCARSTVPATRSPTQQGFPPTEYWQWEASGHESLRDTTGKTLLDYRSLVTQACTASVESCTRAITIAAQINRIVALTYHTLQCAKSRRRLAGFHMQSWPC